MSFKRTLAVSLALAILAANGACIPALAEEIVPAEVQPVVDVVQEAPQAEPAPEPEPAPAPEPEPAPAPAPEPEPAPPAPAPEPEPAPKQEEAPKSAPEPEAPKEEPKEAPKEEPKQEEAPKSEAPAEEKKEEPVAQGGDETPAQEPVHSDDGSAASGDNAPADEGTAPADATPAAGDETAASNPDAGASTGGNAAPADGATGDPAGEPAADATEQPPQETAVPTVVPTAVPEPPEIVSLSASRDSVMLGASVSFSFSVRHATRLKYRVTEPGGGTNTGSLSSSDDHYAFTANMEGRYTFELTATGASGAEVSASASFNCINAPALTLSVKANAPSCHGGDPASFTLSVTGGLELSKVDIRAALGGKTFYQSGEFTPSLTVDVPARGKVSEVKLTASVTDIYDRTAEKSVTIPCAVHAPESRAHWEATMKGVKKTGVWPEDLVAIAKTQIGYKESSKDFGVKYDGGISGYTRYGDWAGLPYEEWCAMFAGFCLHYAGVDEKDFPFAANCQRWINALKKVDLYAPSGSYTPKVGDLAFFDWEGDNDSDHVGIIFALDYNDDGELKGVRTIEGNSKGAAVYDGKYYAINDRTMIGFGLVNRAYGRELEKQHRDLSVETEGFTVEAGVEPEAKVPAFAELSVQELLPGDEGYDRMLSELRGKLTEGELGYARFLRVEFVDEDGSVVEAQAPVALTVTFKQKMVGGKDFVPGVASMSDTPVINRDVDLECKKQSCAFSFTQDVNDALCLFATGALDYKEGTLKAAQGKLSAKVSYTAEAMIPDGATLDFHEIEPETDAYASCLALMGASMPEDESVTMRFFAVDVSFNGITVRPAVPVAVTLDGNQKGVSAELVRVKDAAELVCQTTARKGGKLVVDFNADRFGTFAVEYSAE